MEEWRDIKGYEGHYQISSHGRVKSLKFGREKILKIFSSSKNYYTVNLAKNGKSNIFQMHRLLYQTFIGELIKDLVIDHIDGNQLNNSLDNLQQVSQRQNVIKGERTKNRSSKYVGVSWHKATNKWITGIQINGKVKHLGYFENELEANQAYQNELNKLNNEL